MNKIIRLLRLHKMQVGLTAAAIVGGAAVATYTLAGHDAPTAASAPAPSVSTVAPDPTETYYPGRTGEDTDTEPIYTPGPTATAAPSMIDVARKFATAWARPNLSQQDWLAGIDDYGTNDYVRPLHNIDPRNVPATKVTGAPTVVESRTDRAVVDVPTDAGTLRLTLVSLVGDWWVTDTEWSEPTP